MSLPSPAGPISSPGRAAAPWDQTARLGGPASSTRLVTQIAVLTALSVLVRRFLTPQVSGLNLGGFPLVLSGLVLGPAGGAYVGALSDVVGAYLVPHGEFNPVFTLTAMLTAAVPALVLRAWGEPRVPRPGPLLVAILAGQLTTKAMIIPLYHQLLTGVPWWIDATKGLVVQLAHGPLYAFLAVQILRAIPPRLLPVDRPHL